MDVYSVNTDFETKCSVDDALTTLIILVCIYIYFLVPTQFYFR